MVIDYVIRVLPSDSSFKIPERPLHMHQEISLRTPDPLSAFREGLGTRSSTAQDILHTVCTSTTLQENYTIQQCSLAENENTLEFLHAMHGVKGGVTANLIRPQIVSALDLIIVVLANCVRLR